MDNNLLAGGAIITNPALGALSATTGTAFFSTFFGGLITLAFIVGVIIFFFMVVISGIQWISAGSDKAALEAARHRLTNALVGIVVMFSLYAITGLVSTFFGEATLFSPSFTPITP